MENALFCLLIYLKNDDVPQLCQFTSRYCIPINISSILREGTQLHSSYLTNVLRMYGWIHRVHMKPLSCQLVSGQQNQTRITEIPVDY